MAPYAIAHMKIGLKLHETEYRFGSEERARIYLTNALEPPSNLADQPEFEAWAPALAHEAKAVNDIKRYQCFTVVIGNPPYSKLSANLGPEQRRLVDAYRSVDGQRIVERGALALEMNLQDDYVKFVRISQMAIDRSGVGIIGLITNHGYLSTPTLRGLRSSLLKTASKTFVLDLHGHSGKGEKTPDGAKDENVFDIQQGVAISLWVRNWAKDWQPAVFHTDLYGMRENKYDQLKKRGIARTSWVTVPLTPPNLAFVPRSKDNAEFLSWLSVPESLRLTSDGIVTARDGLVIGFTETEVIDRIEMFRSASGSPEQVCDKFEIARHSAGFNAEASISALRREDDLGKYVMKIHYRPFDFRYLFYYKGLIQSMRAPVTSQLGLRDNAALGVTRQVNRPQYEHALATRYMFEKKTVSHDRNTQVFPILVKPADSLLQSREEGNWTANFAERWRGITGTDPRKPENSFAPFHYTYAVLHSPTYRRNYFSFLVSEYPRIPLTNSKLLVSALTVIGSDLVDLHTMASEKLNKPRTEFIGSRNPEVEKISWSKNIVWIDKARTTGFKGVPEAVWHFHIGGYQVCEKWLKDRKGRTLSKDDIAHYHKIVVALSETIRLMSEIDKVIEKHGGWPLK
jgi:predicted helicase